MRHLCHHFQVAAWGCVLVACSPAGAQTAEPGGQSTLRTLTVAGSEAKADSSVNVVRFSNGSGDPSRHAASVNVSSGPSTVAFVQSHAAEPAKERHSVQQAQFTSEVTAQPAPIAPAETTPAATPSWVFAQPAAGDHSMATAAPPARAPAASVPPAPSASAKLPKTRRPVAPQPVPGWYSDDANLPSQSRQVLDYFGSDAARATLSQLPRRTPIQPSATSPPRQRAKPFEGVQLDSTVSPYLNLHRNESEDESAPNYYAFVRPQLEQQEANRRQQMEIMRLQRQMQATSTTQAMPQYRAPAAATPRTPARYMDTAQFYPQPR